MSERSASAKPDVRCSEAQDDPTSTHEYPTRVLLMDFIRGFVGLVLCCALAIIVGIEHWLAIVLMALAALFCLYLYRLARRGRSRFEMDSHSLRLYSTRNSTQAATQLDWHELQRFELDYFCTRRDGRGGWLQLRLRGHTTAMLRLDSRLSGFEQITTSALQAARSCNVELSSATVSNLQAFGLDDELDEGLDDDRRYNDVSRSTMSESKPSDAVAPGSRVNAR